LRKNLRREVLFDAFSRGRYSTDASIDQIKPLGVVVPRNGEDVAAALAVARDVGVSVLPRGGGTSQCGQTVRPFARPRLQQVLNQVLMVDVAASSTRQRRRSMVLPGNQSI
jgi:FAD/FMN-containing dehydrogenase